MGLQNGLRFASDADFARPVVLVRNKMPSAVSLSIDEYDRACEALQRGRLIIQVRPDKTSQWVWKDKLSVSRDCSKMEFMKQAVASRDNWGLSWGTGLVDFFVLG